MRRSIKRSIKSNIKVQITGGTEVASFAVSNQSISRGALTLTGAAAHTFTASTGTINSIGTVSGDTFNDWDVTFSSGTVTCSPSGDGLANGPYSLTIPCYPEAAQGGTPVNVTFSCTTVADTYTVGTESEYSSAITAVGTAASGERTVELLDGSYDWDNSVLNNKTFNNLVTITSATNPVVMHAMRIGVTAANEVEIRNPNNLRFKNINFVGSFDTSLHTPTTSMLKIKGVVNNLTFFGCNFEGNLTTLGPYSGSFRGALNIDGTTQLSGTWAIENCVISGCGRGLNVGCDQSFVNAGNLVLRGNEIFDCGTDGVVIAGPANNHIIEDNYTYNMYNDEWNVQILSNAYLQRASLVGSTDSQQFTYYFRHNFSAVGSESTIYEQGSALRIYRDVTGKIHCDIDSTGGAQVISLTSTNVVTGLVDVAISVDTSGTSRMHVQRQNVDGSGTWTEEATQTAAGQTLNLTGANVSWLAAFAGGNHTTGNTVIHLAWHGVAVDINTPATRSILAGAFNAKVDPADITTAFGAPIVGFYGFNTVLDAGTNNGTGGDFTKPQGNFDNAHGDFYQGIPGAVRNVEGWVFRRNMMISGRTDSSPFFYVLNQGIFLQDIASVSEQYHYVNVRVFDNFIGVYNTVHGVSVYNALNCAVYNNTIAYDPAWKRSGGLVPRVTFLNEDGGTGSGNISNDNVMPGAPLIDPGFGTETNNIIADDLTAGANAWTNLFDGPDFVVATRDQVLAKFNAKTGGPLLTADPDIGGIGTAFVDWVARTSVPRYNDITPPTLTSPASTNVGTDGWSGTVDTDESNGNLSYIATVNNSAPSVAQIEAGQDGTGASAADGGTQAVSASGTQNVSGTGLTDGTPYYVWYFHRDAAGNPSLVVSGGSFTTDTASSALVDDDFTTSTDTFPSWTETNGVKTYNGTSDRLEFLNNDGVAWSGTSLQLTTVASTTYSFVINVTNPNSSNQIDVRIGTTEGSENISITDYSGDVGAGQTSNISGSFTAPGSTTWLEVRIRGASSAPDNDEIYVNSILVDVV